MCIMSEKKGITMSPEMERRGIEGPPDLFRPRPLKDAVHEFKVEFILGVLKTTGGVQKAAAEILEIQRRLMRAARHLDAGVAIMHADHSTIALPPRLRIF